MKLMHIIRDGFFSIIGHKNLKSNTDQQCISLYLLIIDTSHCNNTMLIILEKPPHSMI